MNTALQGTLVTCKACNQNKPESEYFPSYLHRNVHKCKECTINKVPTPRKDYSTAKKCKRCNIIKEPGEFTQNGKRTKNICKECASKQAAVRNAKITYLPVTEPFNCRTCNKEVRPEDVYIENKRNNKPSTQCKECHFDAALQRKWKRKARIKNSSQMLTRADEARIREIYKQCKMMNKQAGCRAFEVDHRKPLSKGGAHHPDNLQILPMVENRKKGAKYDGN